MSSLSYESQWNDFIIKLQLSKSHSKDLTTYLFCTSISLIKHKCCYIMNCFKYYITSNNPILKCFSIRVHKILFFFNPFRYWKSKWGQFFLAASFIKTGYDFMHEKYILCRAQQCIDGFVVNYLKRRVPQKNSNIYNDLCT